MAYGEPNYDISPPPWYGEIRRGTPPPQNRYQPPNIGIAPHYDKKEMLIDQRWGEGSLANVARQINQGRRWADDDDGSGTTGTTTSTTTTPPTTPTTPTTTSTTPTTPTTGRRWTPRLPRRGGRPTPPPTPTPTPIIPTIHSGGTPIPMPGREPDPITRPIPTPHSGVVSTETEPPTTTPVSIRRPDVPRPPGPGESAPEWPTSPLVPEAGPPPVDRVWEPVRLGPRPTAVSIRRPVVPRPPGPGDRVPEWPSSPMVPGSGWPPPVDSSREGLPVGPLVGSEIPRPPGWVPSPTPTDLPRGTWRTPEGYNDVLSPSYRKPPETPDTPIADIESVFGSDLTTPQEDKDISDEQFLENFLNLKKSKSRTQKRPPKG